MIVICDLFESDLYKRQSGNIRIQRTGSCSVELAKINMMFICDPGAQKQCWVTGVYL